MSDMLQLVDDLEQFSRRFTQRNADQKKTLKGKTSNFLVSVPLRKSAAELFFADDKLKHIGHFVHEPDR